MYPAGLPVVPRDEARREREARRLRSQGIARENVPGTGAEPGAVGDSGEQVVVEGLPGVWRVDPGAVGRPYTGRTALLSPFDRLVHDRAPAWLRLSAG
ncbi:hypothetical protein [Spirilliplanes yamanashiensis]|uniref:Uncharacterized protein n=1 Tax=Spirilliplanes yamanashiensis TaxID=42233 RepID=A0A8J4DI32_9ACTN|nr:hypothetical protein [Spirilliplanes yamanashiensis]MDP9815041.1 uncharacterized protein YcaQ [Spirilliplanes yamanashiensis]GIJ02697.1 hypothetical protein Sya03_20490 [Spirilliplanes yamanashiensis]